GLGLHNYHDAQGSLPTGKGRSYPGAPVYARWSAHALILPYIEQDNLFRSIDFTFPPETPGMAGAVAFRPPYQNPGRPNAHPCRPVVAIFLCPSDAASPDPNWPGQSNYLGSQGSQFLCDLSEELPSTMAPGETPNGLFYYLSHVRLTDISDGTSS